MVCVPLKYFPDEIVLSVVPGVMVCADCDAIEPVIFWPFTYAVFPDRISDAVAVASEVSSPAAHLWVPVTFTPAAEVKVFPDATSSAVASPNLLAGVETIILPSFSINDLSVILHSIPIEVGLSLIKDVTRGSYYESNELEVYIGKLPVIFLPLA